MYFVIMLYQTLHIVRVVPDITHGKSYLLSADVLNWLCCTTDITLIYRKIPKITRGLYFSNALFEGLTNCIFGGAYIRRGLSTEGNLRFKIDWASLIVGRKFTVFAFFNFIFEGNFQVQAPGGLYLEGRFKRSIFALHVLGSLYLEGLIHEGAYFGIFTVVFVAQYTQM